MKCAVQASYQELTCVLYGLHARVFWCGMRALDVHARTYHIYARAVWHWCVVLAYSSYVRACYMALVCCTRVLIIMYVRAIWLSIIYACVLEEDAYDLYDLDFSA